MHNFASAYSELRPAKLDCFCLNNLHFLQNTLSDILSPNEEMRVFRLLIIYNHLNYSDFTERAGKSALFCNLTIMFIDLPLILMALLLFLWLLQ